MSCLMGTIEPDAIYTLEQVQELLQFSRATMTRLLTSGRLKGSKVGKDWRIWGWDISALMENARQGAGGRGMSEGVYEPSKKPNHRAVKMSLPRPSSSA